MKVFAIILALAVGSQASYPLPAPILPAATYGVPLEARPEIAPINTEYTYTVPSLPLRPVEVAAPAFEVPAAPIAPFLVNRPEIQVPSHVTSLVSGSLHPSESLFYNRPEETLVALPQHPLIGSGPTYPSTGILTPPAISAPTYLYQGEARPFEYSHLFPHGYSGLVSSGLGVPAPVQSLQVGTIVSEHHELPTIVHQEHEAVHREPLVVVPQPAHVVVPEIPRPVIPQSTYGLPLEPAHEPIVASYEYEIPQTTHVVVPEVVRPVIPESTYGVPLEHTQVVVPEVVQPVIPQSTYGLPLEPAREPAVVSYEYEIPQAPHVVVPEIPQQTYGVPLEATQFVVPELPRPIIPQATYGLPL